MAVLEKAALARAIKHLTTLGDTDIFPPPFEFSFYEHESDKVVDTLLKIDTSTYSPTSAFECLSPKGNLSFRIAHQLYPADSLLYTAAVIAIAPALEAMKLDPDKGPFAYRFIDDDNNPRLFAQSSNFHDWLYHVRELVTTKFFEDQKYVVETDISDFYSRIYFHRLEHVLDDCGAPNQLRKLIENIIKNSRARQSYGLPVGSSASRILAEALLADTDRMIVDNSIEYSRYVDDFRIIVEHQSDVHAVLCRLAEHLMLTEGLSLNASKTRSYTTNDAVDSIDKRLADVFNDEALSTINRYIKASYDGDDISIEEIDDVDPEILISKLRVFSSGTPDYNSMKVILKALRAVVIEDGLSFIKEFSDLLYHLPRDFCTLAGGIAQRSPESSAAIAAHLVFAIQQAPIKDMALSRIWLGQLFVTQALPITAELRKLLNLTQSVIERRQDLGSGPVKWLAEAELS